MTTFESYIMRQQALTNQLNALANFGQHDTLVLQAQKAQESAYNILGKNMQSYVTQMQEMTKHVTMGTEVQPYINSVFNPKALSELQDISKTVSGITDIENIKNIVLNFENLAISMNNYADSYANISSQWASLTQSLKAFDFQNYSDVLDACNITEEEIFNEIDAVTEELENVEKFNLETKAGDFWKGFSKKHTILWNLIFILMGLLDIGSRCNTFKNFYLPMLQEAYVTIQGTEDFYYIKSEQAKVYADATSKADVICIIGYGEQVTQVEDINMWRKIVYEDENGKETIGWIAKRNLLSQKDYQFNSDKLDNMK